MVTAEVSKPHLPWVLLEEDILLIQWTNQCWKVATRIKGERWQ